MTRQNTNTLPAGAAFGVKYRFSGMLLVLVKSGEAAVSINVSRHRLATADFIMLAEEVSVIWHSVSTDFSAEIIIIPERIYQEVSYRIPTTAYWDAVEIEPVFHLSKTLCRLIDSWCHIWHFLQSTTGNSYQDSELTSHFLTLFLAVEDYIKNNAGGKGRKMDSGSRKIMNRFYSLLAQHSKDNMSVAEYADKLNITSSYLNKICARNGQPSPKEIIDQQTVVEVKTLLLTTRKPIKEIALDVNFKDDSYLCRFFRRMTGQSPKEYRENNS